MHRIYFACNSSCRRSPLALMRSPSVTNKHLRRYPHTGSLPSVPSRSGIQLLDLRRRQPQIACRSGWAVVVETTRCNPSSRYQNCNIAWDRFRKGSCSPLEERCWRPVVLGVVSSGLGGRLIVPRSGTLLGGGLVAGCRLGRFRWF